MRTPISLLKGIRHPEAFHGKGISKGFFEGWYIKLVSEDLSQRWAVIPGIFLGTTHDDGSVTNEAFIQILDGTTGRSWYHSYKASEFHADDKEFLVTIGPNRFHAGGIHIETPQLRGDISFVTAMDPWPVTLAEPGAMGWYGHVPFMECFHAVVSFGHALSGTLAVEGTSHNFQGGRGYIEKDWGKAFPEGYIWMASNHFDTDSSASLVGSVAIIPWLTGAFRGFLIGLKHGDRLYKWATYNSAEETMLRVDDTHVTWSVNGKDGTLEIRAERGRGGLLKAPQRHAMLKRVEETMDAAIEITHRDRKGSLLFQGVGRAAGLEIVGDIDKLVSMRGK